MRTTAGVARAAFALLVVATVAAFFVAQQVTYAPRVVREASHWTHSFSPNGDGHHDVARIAFRLDKTDDVTVSIVNSSGGVVDTLVRSRHVHAHHILRTHWNGRTDTGEVAPPGRYRVRVGLRREGRAVTVSHPIRLRGGRGGRHGGGGG